MTRTLAALGVCLVCVLLALAACGFAALLITAQGR